MQPVFILATREDGTAYPMLSHFDYKAPHANRGTPSRGRRRMSTSLLPRLFKGHRP